MEKAELRLSYDNISDVLYMSFGLPEFGIDEEVQDGIFIRKHPSKGNIIGATIMDFNKRFSKKLDEAIPITLENILT